MTNLVTVIGTIATDPRLLGGDDRVACCTFRVASSERRYDRERREWIDGQTNWYTVNAFRGLAAHSKESFGKGDRIVVHGRLRIKYWEKAEKSGISVEVDADALGHDLRWGTSKFTKTVGPQQPALAASERDEGGRGGAERAGLAQQGWRSEPAGDRAEALSSDGFTPEPERIDQERIDQDRVDQERQAA